MNKLYYSCGREVKNGDTVRYKEVDPGYPEIEEYDYYITIDENNVYSIESALGCLGEIDNAESYELVERWEEGKAKNIIREIEWLIEHHNQGQEFDFFMRSHLRGLQYTFRYIK